MHQRRVSHWEPRGPAQLLRELQVQPELQVRLLRERVRELPQVLELVLRVQRAQRVLGQVLRVQPEP